MSSAFIQCEINVSRYWKKLAKGNPNQPKLNNFKFVAMRTILQVLRFLHLVHNHDTSHQFCLSFFAQLLRILFACAFYLFVCFVFTHLHPFDFPNATRATRAKHRELALRAYDSLCYLFDTHKTKP